MTDQGSPPTPPLPPAPPPAAHPDPEPTTWQRVRHRIIVGAVILIGAVIGLVYWSWEDHAPEPVAAAPPPGPVEATVVPVMARSVPLAPSYLGRTEASQIVEIRARIDGFLEERTFEEGGHVEAGQTLYRIDARPFEAEVAVATARLANAEARLERATRQVERIQGAAAQAAVSESELDEWETEQQVARADVMLEQAQLRQAELDLGYTTIESPIAGVIGQSLIDAGTYVQSGPESLLAVVQQIDPIYAEFSVSEQEVLRWQRLVESGAVELPEVGQLPVRLTLSDGRAYPLEGFINFVGVQVDPSTGTALMRATVPNPDGTLIPGQFAQVTVLGIERLNTILVPQQAVMQTPTGASVYVVTPEGIAEPREIELGAWVGDDWIVEDGLRPGELVVANNLMRMRPGTPVVAAPPAAAVPPPAPAAAAGG